MLLEPDCQRYEKEMKRLCAHCAFASGFDIFEAKIAWTISSRTRISVRRWPECGNMIACSTSLFIHRRTVAGFTRSICATSGMVSNSIPLHLSQISNSSCGIGSVS